jgi:hypothetical protein
MNTSTILTIMLRKNRTQAIMHEISPNNKTNQNGTIRR